MTFPRRAALPTGAARCCSIGPWATTDPLPWRTQRFGQPCVTAMVQRIGNRGAPGDRTRPAPVMPFAGVRGAAPSSDRLHAILRGNESLHQQQRAGDSMDHHSYYAAGQRTVEACVVGSGGFGRSFLFQGMRVPGMRARVAVDVDAAVAARERAAVAA